MPGADLGPQDSPRRASGRRATGRDAGADPGYSPLWGVIVYDNADFDAVGDIDSAEAATILVDGAGHVNCPVAAIE